MITRFLAWLFRSPRLGGRWSRQDCRYLAVHMVNSQPRSALDG